MELKHGNENAVGRQRKVLIVPFMELKHTTNGN